MGTWKERAMLTWKLHWGSLTCHTPAREYHLSGQVASQYLRSSLYLGVPHTSILARVFLFPVHPEVQNKTHALEDSSPSTVIFIACTFSS